MKRKVTPVPIKYVDDVAEIELPEPPQSNKPDIDEQIMDIYIMAVAMELPPHQFLNDLKKALYSLLASEAVGVKVLNEDAEVEYDDAITLSKLKAIMEIKE